jgi:hypothetical protein
VSVDWPVAYKQAFSVGPFYQLIDSQTISVSRKAEQVIITLGKKQRMRWDQLTTNREEHEQAKLNPKGAINTPTKQRQPESVRQSVSPQSQSKLLSNFNKTGKLAAKLNTHSKTDETASFSKLMGSKDRNEAKGRLHTDVYESVSLDPENREMSRKRDGESDAEEDAVREPSSARLTTKPKHKVMFIDTDPKEKNINYQSQDRDRNLKESKDGFPIKKLISGNKQVFSERKTAGRAYATETESKGKSGCEKGGSRGQKGERDEPVRQSYTTEDRSERQNEGLSSKLKGSQKSSITSLRLSQVITRSTTGIDAKPSGTPRNQTPKKGEVSRTKLAQPISDNQPNSKKHGTASGTPGND